jgi:hypothetical protein
MAPKAPQGTRTLHFITSSFENMPGRSETIPRAAVVPQYRKYTPHRRNNNIIIFYKKMTTIKNHPHTHTLSLFFPSFRISWEYNKVGALPVEDYEKTRPPRRSHFEMVLPRKLRQDMLKREWDVPQRQIADAVRNNVKIKNQRKATVNNLGKATKMEEALESAQRKLKRIITFKKPVSRQVADLEAKMNEANRRRGQMRLELAMAGEYDDSVPMVEEASPATSEEPEPESNIPEPVLPKVESAPAAIQASGEIPEKTPESTQ